MSRPIVVERERTIFRVRGRDPVKMMQGLATADIEAVSSRKGAYTAFLTPKGRMVADARIFAWPLPAEPGPELLLSVDPDAATMLGDHIRKFVPPLFARHEDRSDDWRVLGLYGDGASAVLASLAEEDVPASAPEETVVALGRSGAGAFAARTGITGEDGWDLHVSVDHVQAVRSTLLDAGAEAEGPDELERRRVHAGRPMWGAELTPEVIPLEAELLDRAISQTKGCYTGQEVIVRILHRGHVNRHLRRLELEADAPEPGTELFEPELERPRGVVTSAVADPAGSVGLGYVRREVEPPAELRLGSLEGPRVRVLTLP